MEHAERWPPVESSADLRYPARWTTGAKSGVGTATAPRSRIWFTIARGAITEIYYPTVDQANTRELRLVMVDDDGLVDGGDVSLEPIAEGVPGYHVRTRLRRRAMQGNDAVDVGVLHQTVVTDDERPVLVTRLRLEAPASMRLYALFQPHLANQGSGNDGWLGRYKGVPMLFARRGARSLALAYSGSIRGGTCTYVGKEDAWHELHAHGRIVQHRPLALNGNLLLAVELDTTACRAEGGAMLVLALGESPDDAGQQARAALEQQFEDVLGSYVRGWRDFHAGCTAPDEHDPQVVAGYRTSLAMLRAHEDKAHAGAAIASLAIPWGESRGDHDGGGYHLVWPRDLVEVAGGLLAGGLTESARQALLYLVSTQEASGHWPQNMWLDGHAYWRGVQLDEAGLPILLADALARHDALAGVDVWPMVRRAASYIVRHGPVTEEDRWEERAGYSPFTLAVEVAALTIAADFAQRRGEDGIARFLRETADAWNDGIERWTFVRDTDLARRLEVPGYYVRLAPAPRHRRQEVDRASLASSLKNHPIENTGAPYQTIVSPDALALVRFGLRHADDPRIRATIRAIDAELRSETPTGPVWHRFTGDRYGEHRDGSPFDGDGIGRGWPLLAGERAHYEVAHGDLEAARALRRTMLAQASEGGLIPEQVWDASDIPKRRLRCGHASGSAMPLVWAHAELVKLCRSIAEQRVFDTPPSVAMRYLCDRQHSTLDTWWVDGPVSREHSLPVGSTLRVECGVPFTLDWRVDGAENGARRASADSGLGVHFADVPLQQLPAGTVARIVVERDGRRDAGHPGRRSEHVVRVRADDV